MSLYQYPPSPAMVAAEKLNTSPAFKKQVTKVITAVILFFIVYMLLVTTAIALAIACCYMGIKLIVLMPRFITLIAGLGLVAVGVSVIFFLVKFLFAVSKNENPNRIELKEADQPELFAFIRRLSQETKTPFPKKIFISPEVNACVFYNSSFWSMLFPVRKNLEIGLGLVNSINISELKAVIAHEFGHFSQRSMKLGSFTYNVNKIIFDMLYNNSSYTSFLNAWGNLNGMLSVFAAITVKIAEGIQFILRQMYTLINKSYMALSREMEFHADAVAASAAGGNNIVTGLSRLEVAASCYNTTLEKADELLKENKQLDNIYSNQLTVYRNMALQYKLPVKQGLPEVSFDFVQSFSTSRINFKNQWASHPGLQERKAQLDTLDLHVAADETPAWAVFENATVLQQQITEKLYSQVNTEQPLQKIEPDIFNALYDKEMADYTLPLAYKGYYDKRFIDIKDWDMNELLQKRSSLQFEDLFTKQHAQLQASINNNAADVETLNAIRDKQIDTKSFDFDGIKYKPDDCTTIIQQLEQETETNKHLLQQLDKDVFIFFNNYTAGLSEAYNAFKAITEKYDAYVVSVNELLSSLEPFYKGGLTIEEVHTIVARLKEVHERNLKKQLQQLLEDGIICKEENVKLYNEIQSFLEKDYCYFANNNFIDEELSSLQNITIQSADAFYRFKFRQYKQLLEMQLSGYTANKLTA